MPQDKKAKGCIKAFVAGLKRKGNSFVAKQRTEVTTNQYECRAWDDPCYGYDVAIFLVSSERPEDGLYIWPTSGALDAEGGMDLASPSFSHRHRVQTRSGRGAHLGELYVNEDEHGKNAVQYTIMRRLDRDLRERHTRGIPWGVVRWDLGIPKEAHLDSKPLGPSSYQERVHQVQVGVLFVTGAGGMGGVSEAGRQGGGGGGGGAVC
jgi:hypothetical protein